MSARASLEKALADVTLRSIADAWFAGAVVRVERDGKLLFEGAWGDALSTGDAREPMSPSHLFDAASVTKIFTTTAVLRLVTLCRLSLGTSIASLVGGGRPALTRLLDGITIEHLLTHASGLPAWFPFYTRRGAPFEEVLEEVLSAEPRHDGVTYSDINFMLLGRAIEETTRMPLAPAMDALVLAPLHLSATSYGPRAGAVAATELGNRIEQGMVRERGLSFDAWRDPTVPIRGECDDGNCFHYFGGVAGHAGIFTDARDLCALGRPFLDEGRYDGAQYLDAALVADSRRDHGGERGLGFQLGECYPDAGFGHTGFTGTYLYLNQREKLAVAALTNRLHVAEPRKIDEYRRAVADAALDAGRS